MSPNDSQNLETERKTDRKIQQVLDSWQPRLVKFLEQPSTNVKPFLLPKGKPHAAFVESLELPLNATIPDLFLHGQGCEGFVFAKEFDRVVDELVKTT
jgi:hypothetical protein